MSAAEDHAMNARQHIEWAHEQQASDGEYEHSVRDMALLAQAEATLALVEEQRTANLIAAFERDAVQPPTDTHLANGTRQAWWNGVSDQITERLGLA